MKALILAGFLAVIPATAVAQDNRAETQDLDATLEILNALSKTDWTSSVQIVDVTKRLLARSAMEAAVEAEDPVALAAA